MRMRQVHLDFHTSEKIGGIGTRFSKEDFQEALRIGHVDSITVFSKCHHGWSYHPTDANEMHPALTFDLLRAQIDAAHEIGVKAPIYLSAGLDEKYAVKHPEHLVHRKLDRAEWSPDFSKAGYHVLCFNSPYMETLVEQVKEVCERYDPDGLFLDIAAPRVCYCDSCLALMKKQGIDPTDTAVVEGFSRWTYLNYTYRIEDAAHSVKPGVRIFHNGGHTPRGMRVLERLNSHIEIESLPTGGWGYDNLPMTARSVQSHGMEYLGMTGKFHKGWGEFGGFKHPNALIYETALAVANGAACSIGDQLHPLGETDKATYRLIGRAYSEIERKEPWLTDVKSTADIAFLSYEAHLAMNPKEKPLDPDYKFTDTGVLRILLEGHYLFDVVDYENDLSGYRLVILPDNVKIDFILRKKLDAFVKAGGKILASGASATADGAFVYDFGAEYLGDRELSPVYFRPAADSTLDSTGYVLYAPSKRIALTDGRVLATLHEPYFNRTAEHFCSHLHAPERMSEGEAGIVLGKDGAYIAHQIFREYAKVGCLAAKRLVLDTIEALIGDVKRVTVGNYPSAGIVTVMEQEKENRSVLHLVYAQKTCKGENKIEVIEECPTLYRIPVRFRTDKRAVQSVTVEPCGTALPYTVHDDGSISFTVPAVDIHAMIVISYR